MWMMGYNDGGELINSNIQDSFNARRLRNLMPRPAIASASTNPPCLIHGNDLFALNHHLAMAEQNKRDFNTQQVVVSSRWNPTPEQLHTLEELYRRGTRTPSAEQIQHITAQLRRYGKIEGKNVFYWFQNHKARERQKRRRQSDEQQQQSPHNEKKDSLAGANRTVDEVEQTKNWASPTNSSTIAPQKSVSSTTQGGTKASDVAECKADGWLQFDHEGDAELELLNQRGKNATWQMMRLSCSSSPNNNLITTINSSSSAHQTATTTSTIPSTVANIINRPKLDNNNNNFVNIFVQQQNIHQSAQTLELFPLMSGSQFRRPEIEESCDHNEREGLDKELGSGLDMNSDTPNYPYFEFLPLKN